MSDNKNLIIACLLSAAVLGAWSFFFEAPIKHQAQQVQQTRELQQQAQAKKEAEAQAPINRPRDEVLAETQEDRIKITSPWVHGSLSLKGLRFDDLTLAGYHETMDPHSKEVVLLSPSVSNQAYFAEFGWLAKDSAIKVPDSSTVWKTNSHTLAPKKPVTLTWDNGEGLEFSITISLNEEYLFSLQQDVRNTGSTEATIMPYGLINRVWLQDHKMMAILHEGPIGVLQDKLEEYNYADLAEQKESSLNNRNGWIGISDKYWLSAIIPARDTTFDANFAYTPRQKSPRYQADYRGEAVTIAPGASESSQQYFFAGAKKIAVLDKYTKELSIPLFDRALDFGHLYFITKPLFLALKYFHALLGNFGLAILLLTVVVKFVMFPLANKSYRSIHKMKLLQPDMLALKEKHAGNPQELNREVMALYRRNGVNPLSGCLPLLVQIPVFFALYKVLYITIEMRHAPFYGWIKDLSAPDHTNLFNLFGLIPWDPPSLLHVGALPIIMGITMYLQQKMNPEPSDPVQAKVMKLLPFVFTFMFASFPAGLIIYWAWNNTLSILQQWIITRPIKKMT